MTYPNDTPRPGVGSIHPDQLWPGLYPETPLPWGKLVRLLVTIWHRLLPWLVPVAWLAVGDPSLTVGARQRGWDGGAWV